ncbi:MAG: PmoA family protein [Armatimonadetes bacterium]|nr:PmoA family protein [Armatimonadota bacterium]
MSDVRFSLSTPASLPATLLLLKRPPELALPEVFLVQDETSGHEACAQTDPLHPDYFYLPVEGLDAGAARRYRIREGSGNPCGRLGVEVAEDGDSLSIDVHGERFTRYHYGREAAPARPYFYPVLAAGGIPVTRNYPMADVPGESRDHPHHRSLWVAHGDVNGADNWSEGKGHARTEHLAFEGIFSGPLAGGFREKTRWVTSDGEPLLNETREVRVYGVEEPHRLLDLTLSFTPSADNVTFGDTKEGGLISVRVATSMDAAKDGAIVNGSGGINEKETWGKPAPWCDYYGPVQGRIMGITLMDHPSNPRYPTYWHVRNYGLMTANPFGLSYFYNDKSKDGSLTIPAGETLTWRYRMLVHPGTTEDARVDAQYAAFTADLNANFS